jgi:multimeric flavodoxin WrbA
VEEINIDTLPSYDEFIVGSPNDFGTMAWPIKNSLMTASSTTKNVKLKPPQPSLQRK